MRPSDDATISQAMVHYSNIAYRIGKGFDIDEKPGGCSIAMP
jgi:hypothetical protein